MRIRRQSHVSIGQALKPQYVLRRHSRGQSLGEERVLAHLAVLGLELLDLLRGDIGIVDDLGSLGGGVLGVRPLRLTVHQRHVVEKHGAYGVAAFGESLRVNDRFACGFHLFGGGVGNTVKLAQDLPVSGYDAGLDLTAVGTQHRLVSRDFGRRRPLPALSVDELGLPRVHLSLCPVVFVP